MKVAPFIKQIRFSDIFIIANKAEITKKLEFQTVYDSRGCVHNLITAPRNRTYDYGDSGPRKFYLLPNSPRKKTETSKQTPKTPQNPTPQKIPIPAILDNAPLATTKSIQEKPLCKKRPLHTILENCINL